MIAAPLLPRPLSLFLPTPAATDALARALAAGPPGGKPPGAGEALLLRGPIGAGKTHFARAFIRTMLGRDGICEDVPSPSFTLVQVYAAGPLEIWHADLYRLGHPDEIWELGLAEALETALCLVEWPERADGALPAVHSLLLDFTLPEAPAAPGRQVVLRGGPRWAAAIDALRIAPPGDAALGDV